MKHPRVSLLAAGLVVAALAATACGPKAFSIQAKYPTEPSAREPDRKMTAFVKSVTDARSFEKEPTSLSLQATWDDPPFKPAVRIVGARGDSIHAASNIYLDDAQDVESIVRHMLRAALVQAGFELAESEQDADVVVEAGIGAFWIWMISGGMTIHIQTKVQADVTLTGKDGVALEIQADGSDDSPDVGTSPTSYVYSLQEALYGFYDDLAADLISLEIAPAPAPAPAPASDD